MARLVCCSSCSTYVLPGEGACPFCGAPQRSNGRAAAVIAVGLALGACGDDNANPDSETINSAAAYGVEETIGDTEQVTSMPTTTPDTETSSGSESSSGSSSGGSSGSSGVETDTDTGTDTDTETDTDTGGTTLEPDYGVPTTSG